MQLVILNNKTDSNKQTVGLLMDAAASRGIESTMLTPKDFNLVTPPSYDKDTLLYRVSVDTPTYRYERLLLSLGNPTTIYGDIKNLVERSGLAGVLRNFQTGLPVIPSVFSLPTDNEQLEQAVEKLGGLPIILKVMGGSHGIGVMRADSFMSLKSLVDFVSKMDNQPLAILRKYLADYEHARLIVVGDRVIDSVEYVKPSNDFRTNAHKTIIVNAKQYGEAIDSIAINAVESLGLEFGGVDILITPEQPYIAEVNCPCFFPRCQMATGVDTAGILLDWLDTKSNKITL